MKASYNRTFSGKKTLMRIAVAAMFLALSVVIRVFVSFYLPILGAAGIKIDFSGVFSVFPALLFGPVYGGVVFALSDLLGYVLKPTGAYIPLLTLTQFLTGFLIGIIWNVLMRPGLRRAFVRGCAVFLTALLVVSGIFGAAFHIALWNDGVISSPMVNYDTLPSKGALDSAKLSPLSEVARYVSRYNNDSYTLNYVSYGTRVSGEIHIPAYVERDGYLAPVKSISAGALEICPAGTRVYIPASVTDISPEAFNLPFSGVICAPENSAADVFASEQGFSFYVEDYEGETVKYDDAGLTFSTNDAFRKNLAFYINIITLGTLGASMAAVVAIVYGMVSSRIRKKKKNPASEHGYVKMFLAIFIPRFIVTTINTEILRRTLAVWNDRAFMVLWVPRAAEEILTCVILVYLTFALYTVYTTKILKMDGVAEKL